MKKTQGKLGYLMILLAGSLWGSIGLFVRVLSSLGASSSTIAFLRIAVGAICLLPLIFLMGGPALLRINKVGLVICAILGIFSQAGFNFAYNESISRVGMATASVMLYSSPIFVALMARIFFQEKLDALKLLALSINVLGCVLTVTGGDFTTINFSIYGVAMGVLSGFLYALMTIISKISSKKYHSLTILFYSFVFGAICLGIISNPWPNIKSISSPGFLVAVIGYGILPSAGAYYFYMLGLSKDLETSKIPIIASIETVVAALIGIFIFKEATTFFKIIGIICVLSSILLMNLIKFPVREEVSKDLA